MHLKREQYKDIVKSIVSIAKNNTTIIISYSDGNRTDDEQYFENVDLDYIIQICQQYNFRLVKKV
jgi:hypothetical protein